MFSIVVLIVGIVAGGIAAIAGFGIGSLLTPLFATRMDIGLAVAAVSIPHALGTLVGGRVLKRIPETIFRRVVSAIILALGFYMLYKAITGFASGG